MPLPPSFAAGGFISSSDARKKRWLPGLKRPGIMIGTEGETNTGKSEFILSCPGPGILLAVDRGADAIMDNPSPPASRRQDFAICEVKTSLATQAENHKEHWANFTTLYMNALKNPDARTVAVDGDSDTWEQQRLAAFGKLTQIPSIMYVEVNAARRSMIARAYDSGKVIVSTNKVKKEYVEKRDAEGNVVTKDGKPERILSGHMVRQGFDDNDYLWHVQIRHMRRDPGMIIKTYKGEKEVQEMQWGIKILKAKSNPQMAGWELWGDECNFAGLVQVLYPDVELKEWGL